jgi:hypothetical protein
LFGYEKKGYSRNIYEERMVEYIKLDHCIDDKVDIVNTNENENIYYSRFFLSQYYGSLCFNAKITIDYCAYVDLFRLVYIIIYLIIYIYN